MRLLVTGGAGYIGGLAVRRLLEQGHEVTVYDNLSTGSRSAIPAQALFVFGDVRDEALLGRVLKDRRIEAVLHFAAKLVVPESFEKPLEYYETNALGTLRLSRACEAAQVRKLVFSSTAAVYGELSAEPVAETQILRPLNPYGKSKAIAEKFLLEGSPSIQTVILRYFNVAGASDEGDHGPSLNRSPHLISAAARAALGQIPELLVFGDQYPTEDGTGVRDYIHVEDLVDAHLAALAYLDRGGASLVLNCGYQKGASVLQVHAAMENATGRNIPLRRVEPRPGDPAQVVAQCEKIRTMLQWEPQRTSLEKICLSTFEWEKKMAARV